MRIKTKSILALLLCGFLAFSGCGKTSEDYSMEQGSQQKLEVDKSETIMEEQEKEAYIQPEMKGEITISCFYEQEFLTMAAEKFMEAYPDVTVTINVFNETSGVSSAEDYQTYLNTKIMTGNAEDIIFNSFLPITKYAEMGVFEDLGRYLSLTPEMNDEHYFMNVLEAAKEENGIIYLIPYMAKFDVVSFSEKLLSEQPSLAQNIQSASFSDRMMIANELIQNTNKRNAFLVQMNELSFANYWIKDVFRDFVNIKDKTVNIKTEEYTNLLNMVKNLSESNAFGYDKIDFYNTEYYFATTCDYDVQAAFYELDTSADVTLGMPIADEEGKVAINANGCLAMSSASENKDLAWEFIRYLLSDEVQSLPSLHGLAVNKAGFDAVVERYYKFYSEGNRSSVEKDEYAELLTNWMKQINDCDVVDSAIWNLIEEENGKFFDGKQSAEETAAVLQRKLEQYFNE